MGKVKSIEVQYKAEREGTAWLHMVWDPGGSGVEQFRVVSNGVEAGISQQRDGSKAPGQTLHESFQIASHRGQNSLRLDYISGDGLHFHEMAPARTQDWPLSAPAQAKPDVSPQTKSSEPPAPSGMPKLNPSLKFPTVEAYGQTIGERGILLESDYVWIFAPARLEQQARTIFPYLVRAYAVMMRTVGQPTEYKIVVYHFPEGHPDAFGGTSNCTLWYGYKNLDLQSQEEWIQYGVPHVSGYIEEMGHNFVASTHAQFGWESMGWSLGVRATSEVSPNPEFARQLQETRTSQLKTLERYRAAGNVFPADIAPNLVDRIHAYLLYDCEQRYGQNFWPDAFREIRNERNILVDAGNLPEDQIRDARYRITVGCFDRLPGLHFKEVLRSNGISLTTDVKSLNPAKPGWNRRLE